MKLIVGLGNPGKKYRNTRHNAGFILLDMLALAFNEDKWGSSDKFESLIIDHRPTAILVKPQTYMNNSGQAVEKLVNFYKVYVPDLWVIHDDLDLRMGVYKIQQNHGPRLHYGVNSIEEQLGSEAFWRVRIGVDNRQEGNRIPGEDYVLQNFSSEELATLTRLLKEAVTELVSRIEQDAK